MSSNEKQRLLDLLADQVLFGLTEEESAELKQLENLYPEISNDYSLELTASAIALSNLEKVEPLPDNLRNRIMSEAEEYFADLKTSSVLPFQSQKREVKSEETTDDLQPVFQFAPKKPLVQWLGWAFAGLASLALVFSVWTNLQQPKVVEKVVEVPPKVLTETEQYNNLLASAKDLRKTVWANPANEKETYGEIVWSEAEQKGFMKIKGLAANDATKEQYQLWIFDESQDEKTPIDGGVFDVKENGEVLIPIKANLKFKNPKLFAITKEKPGGVMVSDRKKIAAVGKVQI